MMSQHGCFGETSRARGELEVADRVRKDFGFGVVKSVRGNLGSLGEELLIGGVPFRIATEDDDLGGFGLVGELG